MDGCQASFELGGGAKRLGWLCVSSTTEGVSSRLQETRGCLTGLAP